MIRRLIKFLVVVAIIGFVGLAAFAWLGDLSPERQTQSITVTLDAN